MTGRRHDILAMEDVPGSVMDEEDIFRGTPRSRSEPCACGSDVVALIGEEEQAVRAHRTNTRPPGMAGMAGHAVTYRVAPVTQRDGSELASSNCRLASAACGIDYHSKGAILSNGAEMRARQSDQSGGTDSGDAAEAWASYGETLRIRDGATFADALYDLEAGRLVHLDVWAASLRRTVPLGDRGLRPHHRRRTRAVGHALAHL